MKIAITGHTAGIGKSFAEYLSKRDHEIVGLSKRDGNNIRNIPKIVEKIIHCDMFINNAQAGFAQTELFIHVADAWHNDAGKMIWNISTQMAEDYSMPTIPTLDSKSIIEYRVQKRALEDAIRTVKDQDNKVRLITIRPGSVATESYKTANIDSADADSWVKAVCDFYIQCRKNNLYPNEISVGFKKEAPEL